MIGVVADESKLKMLDNELANPPFTTLKMGLYTNTLTPDHATVIGDLTEPIHGGYAQQDVTGWGSATLTGDFHALAVATNVVFSNTTGSDSATIKGWFYRDTVANKLVAAATFDTPFVIPAGGSVTLTPKFRKTHE